MHRPKSLADDATPSGNGVAAFALQRLGFLIGETCQEGDCYGLILKSDGSARDFVDCLPHAINDRGTVAGEVFGELVAISLPGSSSLRSA